MIIYGSVFNYYFLPRYVVMLNFEYLFWFPQADAVKKIKINTYPIFNIRHADVTTHSDLMQDLALTIFLLSKNIFYQFIYFYSFFRHFVRCSVCDFVTKVRLNLVKHLKLHLKVDNVPFITPVNPATSASEAFSRMTSWVHITI